jgi:hypothetical protein
VSGERRAKRPAQARRSARDEATLERVRVILAETCKRDGQGSNLQEPARRKAYRAGINRALQVLDEARPAREA